MTCFNRRDKTLCCLEHLFSEQQHTRLDFTVVLVDDGSTDGTSAAVRSRFPSVHLIAGTGSLYWNRGMRVAFDWALQREYDFYLWLNDDTLLLEGALTTMLRSFTRAAEQGLTAVVTGSTSNPTSGKRTYGGMRWKQGWRRELAPVEPHPEASLPCDTMNGNCTLIPHRIAQAVGNLDPAFQHSFGDLDYGFRVRTAGFHILVAPGFVATCSDNSKSGTWRDSNASLRKRWAHLTSAKGSPFAEWCLYCQRHLGWMWPLYTVSPYLKTLLSSFAVDNRGAQSNS